MKELCRKTDIPKIALIAVMVCAFLGATLTYAHAADREYIKIGLRYGENAPLSCTVSSDSGFILGVVEGGAFREGLPLPAYTKLEVSLSGRYAVVTAEGVLISDDFGGSGCIMPYDYLDGGGIRYEGASYRGGIGVFVNPNNTLNVINCLDAEQYLYGVISGEIGRSNPMEALKAQAVASRSYALKKKGNHSGSGFDLCNNVHCQVYKGRGGEYAETNKSVDETAGQVLLYRGEVVSGYYYKNSGGHTQNSEDVWNGKEDYLRGVGDEYSPDYPWTWRASFQEIRAALAGAGSDPGDISSVEVSRRNASGHVLEMRIKGSRATVTLAKEQIRTVLGFDRIRSLIFSMDGAGTAAMDGAGATVIVQGGSGLFATNGRAISKVSGKIYVLNGEGTVVAAEASELRAEGADLDAHGVGGQTMPGSGRVGEAVSSNSGGGGEAVNSGSGGGKAVNAGSGDGDKAVSSGSGGNGEAVNAGSGSGGSGEMVSSGTVYFSGKGYGHGVGMPQDSAIEMAKRGFDYIAILEKYYTGIQIGTR